MKKNIVLFLLTLIFGALLFYFVLDKVGTKEIWQAFLSFSPVGIFWILILTIIYTIFGIWRWQVIIKGMGSHFSLKDISGAWLAGFGLGYLTPIAVLGGEAVRSYIIKKKKNFPWKEGIVSIFIDKVFEGTTFFLITILGIIFFISKVMAVPLKIWVVLLILLFPIGGITFFYLRAYRSQSMVKFIQLPLKKFIQSKNVHQKVNGLLNSSEKIVFNFFEVKNKYTRQCILLSLIRGAISIIRSWFLVLFLGFKIGIISALSITAFTNISYLIPLPAALGSHEAIQAFVFPSLNLSSHSAIAFALILRAFDMLMAFCGVFVVLKLGTQWIKKKIIE